MGTERREKDTGPLRVGEKFGRYEIHAHIGHGGFAHVYEGMDPFLERRVAIKVITRARKPERARQEARALVKLKHPNIIPIFEGGMTPDGIMYIVMERLEGRSLRAVLKEHPALGVAEVLLITRQIASALGHAHRQRVIHRDIKPENVFVQPGNEIMVLDFGIAKLCDELGITTLRDRVMGTAQYMSPEHLLATGVTERSDLYALGSMMYEALAGEHPCVIGTKDLTLEALINIQLTRMPPRLETVNRRVPADVGRLVNRLLAKKASERFASAEAVVEAITACEKQYLSEHPELTQCRELWRDSRGVARFESSISTESSGPTRWEDESAGPRTPPEPMWVTQESPGAKPVPNSDQPAPRTPSQRREATRPVAGALGGRTAPGIGGNLPERAPLAVLAVGSRGAGRATAAAHDTLEAGPPQLEEARSGEFRNVAARARDVSPEARDAAAIDEPDELPRPLLHDTDVDAWDVAATQRQSYSARTRVFPAFQSSLSYWIAVTAVAGLFSGASLGLLFPHPEHHLRAVNTRPSAAGRSAKPAQASPPGSSSGGTSESRTEAGAPTMAQAPSIPAKESLHAHPPVPSHTPAALPSVRPVPARPSVRAAAPRSSTGVDARGPEPVASGTRKPEGPKARLSSPVRDEPRPEASAPPRAWIRLPFDDPEPAPAKAAPSR